MDEITYWIYTKRAPCLMNYDEMIKKREQLEASAKHKKPLSISDDTKTPSPCKKKRKISILDDDSVSEKAKNVYFESSNQPQVKQTVHTSCKSSDVDINVKKTCLKEKAKRRGLQKKSRTTLHKKQTAVASMPKATTSLRRSLRNSRKCLNDSNLHNGSFEILNGACQIKSPTKTSNSKPDQCKTAPENLVNGDQATEVVRINTTEKKGTGANGKFEDLSDVSGFTANYIRSTKIDATKNGKQIGSKNRKILLKESRQGMAEETVDNESVHSKNCLNIDTPDNKKKNNDSTLLKFINVAPSSLTKNSRTQLNTTCQTDFGNSLQAQSNSSHRYPKRSKNHSQDIITSEQSLNGKNCLNSRTKDSGENLNHTRSRRSLVLTIKHSDSKSKQDSSVKGLKKKSLNKSGKSSTGGRDSLRDKSGFAACFSDSDDDKPLRSQKYFC